MIRITRTEINRMANIILDEDTGMTALDLWEWSHSFNDIDIIEDSEENNKYIK